MEKVKAFDMRSSNSVLIGQRSTNYNIGRWSFSQVSTGGGMFLSGVRWKGVLLGRQEIQIDLDNMNRSRVTLQTRTEVNMVTDGRTHCSV